MQAECLRPVLLIHPVWQTKAWWPVLDRMTIAMVDIPDGATYQRPGAEEIADPPMWRSQARLIASDLRRPEEEPKPPKRPHIA